MPNVEFLIVLKTIYSSKARFYTDLFQR